jgi:hypothetical protein
MDFSGAARLPGLPCDRDDLDGSFPMSTDNRATETAVAPDEADVAVTLSRARWKKVAAYLDWHGKDTETEAIVDVIRTQINDE